MWSAHSLYSSWATKAGAVCLEGSTRITRGKKKMSEAPRLRRNIMPGKRRVVHGCPAASTHRDRIDGQRPEEKLWNAPRRVCTAVIACGSERIEATKPVGSITYMRTIFCRQKTYTLLNICYVEPSTAVISTPSPEPSQRSGVAFVPNTNMTSISRVR